MSVANKDQLAIHGGPKAKTTAYRTGRRFGREEMRELREALEQNTLFYAKGTKVRQLCREFADMFDMKHAVAATSGTAAIHIALAGVDAGVGDEVITSVLTDAGSFMPILLQNAIPVFADIDPRTYNMTAETIAARITPRTKAILVIHLTGCPADMDPILALARKHDLKVIEDCAQSYYADYRGRWAGTMGHVGCFSLNDFKHISAGDAGLVVTDDDKIAGRMAMFADKCYPRDETGRRAGEMCEFMAANYRMSELCGAVGLAQIRKLKKICAAYRDHGELLTRLITKTPGILPPMTPPGCRSSNWYYMFRICPDTLGVSRNDFMAALQAEGLPAGFYLRRVDQYGLFRNHNIAPPRKDGFMCPYDCPAYGGGRLEYKREDCPNVDVVLDTAIILQMSDFYSKRDIRESAAAINKVARYYTGQKIQ